MPSKKPSITDSELARRTLARRRLLYFTRQTQVNYDPGWVHDDICKRLERFSRQVVEQQSPRLILLMPPRHGKSTLASVSFPSWHLGQYPTHEYVNASYNLDLPMRFSRQVRDLFRDPLYGAIFPNARLSPDSQSIESWLTTSGGGFTAVGVGGGLTGKGAHIIGIDDPIKNMEEADSALTRDNLFNWYQSVAYTRLAPGGGVLVVQTCWHDDDLAGRLQKVMASGEENADVFEVIRYPAVSFEYEFRHVESMDMRRMPADTAPDQISEVESEGYELLRSPGEALHPARYDIPALNRYRANLAPRIWNALYQQSPTPDEGMYFRQEYFRYEAVRPSTEGRNIYQAWDFAIGQKQMNDWTVGVTLLQDETDALHVMEVIRFRGDSYTIIGEMLDAYQRWGVVQLESGGVANQMITLGVEDGQIWKAIKPLYLNTCSERLVYPVLEEMKPLTDKVARARPLQGRMQQGRVYFWSEASWRTTVEHELLRFPTGEFDDIVDALAWGAQLASGRPPPSVKKPPVPASWRDKLSHLPGMGEGSHMTA